jgi:hypothetical protein
MERLGKTLIAIFCVIVLVIAVSVVWSFRGDEKEDIEEEINPDSDGDGMLDEWEILYGLDPSDPTDSFLDPDDDGLNNLEEHGTRTIPTDPDTDDDSAKDGEDVDPLIDSVVVVQFTHYKMEDPGEPGAGQVDVYFKIRLNDVELTSDVIIYDSDEGNVSLDFIVIYDMPDNTNTVDITFSWYDDDVFFDDKLDCSEFGDSCDIIYSVLNHSWWGDNSNGTTSGNYDGSINETYYFDEDDITINYTIFDSVGYADEIAAILEDAGSENGFEDYSELIRYHRHIIFDAFVEWCLEHPEFFAKLGGWWLLVAAGLIILGVAIYLYEDYHLQNEDLP